MLQELPKVFDYPRLCKEVDNIIKEINIRDQRIKELETELSELREYVEMLWNMMHSTAPEE